MATDNTGFSKFDRSQRLKYITDNGSLTTEEATGLYSYDATEPLVKQIFGEMIENYIGNFPLPMGILPHLLINGERFMVPFVTEESSVVAAAAKAAKYWASRGGFRAEVTSMTKKGQVHFTWNGSPHLIQAQFPNIQLKLLQETEAITKQMSLRGGGITAIQLLDKRAELTDYYQLDLSFETADAMGANFINSCLETIAAALQKLPELNSGESKVQVIMAILSNYTPDCTVNCQVECPVEELSGWDKELTGQAFANKFKQAVDIANLDISRAVTHNKGIMNGVDAVLLATGNDCRATAAAVHSYAARSGTYKSLSTIELTGKIFRYEITLPLPVGTAGGITRIHPMVKMALAIVNNPDARQLMMIAAASGMASNFSAIASLVTTGIQHGHMRMHLSNVLNQLQADLPEREKTHCHFRDKTVTYSAVEAYINEIRRAQ